MKCSQIKRLLAAYDDGELPVAESQMIEQHLAHCVDCYAALAAYRALRGQLALLEHISVDTEIADETIARILAEGIDPTAESRKSKRRPAGHSVRIRSRTLHLPVDDQGHPLPDLRPQIDHQSNPGV